MLRIDTDLIEEDRPRVFRYIEERFGIEKTARVAAYGTMAELAFIEDAGRGLREFWKDKHGDDPNNPWSLPNIDKIKALYNTDANKAKEKYPELFYFFDGMVGTRISQSVHPAGMVVAPIELDTFGGVFWKDGERCLLLDMEEVHDSGLAKYDLLALKTVKVIRDTCRLLGKSYPLTHEIDWNEQEVYEDMIKSPVQLFEFESAFAFDSLRKFKPTCIEDMSMVTAAIRPSGASYRNELLQRKQHKNPSRIIDKLLADNLGFLIYQEDTILFLQEICGLSGSEADTVRRAIGRKRIDILEKALPSILEGYCDKSTQPRDVAEAEAMEFLKIIEDSASYQFGKNHSIAYCLLGYLCAYYRYHNPVEFITASLNVFGDRADKVADLTQLAGQKGIHVFPAKFGVSSAYYAPDTENNRIYKGIASVKYLNAAAADSLLEFSKTNPKHFVDIVLASKELGLDARQLGVLIKVNYFSDYGNIATLLALTDFCQLMKNGERKSIDRSQASIFPMDVTPYVNGKTKAGADAARLTILDMHEFLVAIEEALIKQELPEITWQARADYAKEFLGYVDITTNDIADRRKLYIQKITPLFSKDSHRLYRYRLETQSVGTGNTAVIYVDTAIKQRNDFKEGSIIYADSLQKNSRGFWRLQSYRVLQK